MANKDKNKEFPGYAALVNEFAREVPAGRTYCWRTKPKNFILLYVNILKVKNILSTFDTIAETRFFPTRYAVIIKVMYIDLYNEYRKKKKGEPKT
jgi:type I restriction enzyme R subunit